MSGKDEASWISKVNVSIVEITAESNPFMWADPTLFLLTTGGEGGISTTISPGLTSHTAALLSFRYILALNGVKNFTSFAAF